MATAIAVYGMRTRHQDVGVLDLEMLLLILHDLKIKGISQIINYNTFGYEEVILADIYLN